MKLTTSTRHRAETPLVWSLALAAWRLNLHLPVKPKPTQPQQSGIGSERGWGMKPLQLRSGGIKF